MKQCPHCGAQLQEQARFCLYCMRSLEEKPNITPKLPRSRRWLPWVIGGIVLAAAVLIFLLSPGGEEAPSQRETATPSLPSTVATTSVAEGTSSQSICTFEGFTDSAMYADTTLWEPFMAFNMGTTGQWDKFSIPVHLPDSQMNLYFYHEGVKICAILSNVRSDSLDDAAIIIDSAVDLLCHGYPTGRKNIHMSAEHMQSGKLIEAEAALANTIVPEDPRGSETDATVPWTVSRQTVTLSSEKYGYPDFELICELRQRTWEGSLIYDIFLYFVPL